VATEAAASGAAAILIVEDDRDLSEMLRQYLNGHGFRTAVAGSGAQARRLLGGNDFDLVLLDLMLPDATGLDLARELRVGPEPAPGIIMLTGQGEPADRIVGLEVGADDYLVKPVELRELLARVRSVLRRVGRAAAQAPPPEGVVAFDGWRLDRRARKLFAPDGREVQLTTGEYELLLVFVDRPQHVLDRDRLLDLTRGRERDPFDRSVDVLVGRLRRKIEPDAKHPTIITTVRGAGYMFAPRLRGGA